MSTSGLEPSQEFDTEHTDQDSMEQKQVIATEVGFVRGEKFVQQFSHLCPASIFAGPPNPFSKTVDILANLGQLNFVNLPYGQRTPIFLRKSRGMFARVSLPTSDIPRCMICIKSIRITSSKARLVENPNTLQSQN